VDRLPLYYGANSSNVFSDKTTDLKPSNVAAEAMVYNISPAYFDAARTAFVTGRTLTWHDDKNSPPVAVVNREFARRLFGSGTNALGGHYKMRDGTRVEVVGIVEDGKYASLAEDPQPAMFLPILQSPSSQAALVLRSNRDPHELVAAIRNKVHDLDAGLPFDIRTWRQELDSALLPSRIATISLGVLGMMGAMLSITGIFGMAAYSVSKRGACLHRVSGKSARSGRLGGSCSGDVVARTIGHVDSSATRACSEPFDPAARRVSCGRTAESLPGDRPTARPRRPARGRLQEGCCTWGGVEMIRFIPNRKRPTTCPCSGPDTPGWCRRRTPHISAGQKSQPFRR